MSIIVGLPNLKKNFYVADSTVAKMSELEVRDFWYVCNSSRPIQELQHCLGCINWFVSHSCNTQQSQVWCLGLTTGTGTCSS